MTEPLCTDCGAAPATVGRFCEPCVFRDLPPERDPAVVRRERRVRRAACMTILWGVRGDEPGRAAGIAAAAREDALAELAEVMLAAVRFHLRTVPAALAVFEAALAAEEHQHAEFDGPPEVVGEVLANRVLLCRNTIAGNPLDRLETGLELELHAYSLVRDAAEEDR